jgi:hypothetical protein
MFVRDAAKGRRKKRKMWVTRRRKRRRRKKKGKCASVIGVVKSRLVDRIYIHFFSFPLLSFSIILLPIDRFPDDHQRKEQGQLVEKQKSKRIN